MARRFGLAPRQEVGDGDIHLIPCPPCTSSTSSTSNPVYLLPRPPFTLSTAYYVQHILCPTRTLSTVYLIYLLPRFFVYLANLVSQLSTFLATYWVVRHTWLEKIGGA